MEPEKENQTTDEESYVQIEFKSSEGEVLASSTMVPQSFSTARLEELLNMMLQNVSISYSLFCLCVELSCFIRKNKFLTRFG